MLTLTSSNRNENIRSAKISESIQKHSWLIILLVVLYILSYFTVTRNPRGFEIPALKESYILFAPSFASLILIYYIGFYLLYRYHLKPISRNERLYQLSWGVSFLVYGLLFIGLSFQAFGFKFADMTKPEIFFIWRLPMIFWVSGMWIGTASLFTDNRKLIFSSGIFIDVTGLAWFVYGLLIIKNIEQTMYGFLFWLFIPMCFIIAYIWWQYSRDMHVTSALMIAIGFGLMGISYAAWAPWHFSDLLYIYFIFYQLFIVSISFILAGFFALPKELLSRSEL